MKRVRAGRTEALVKSSEGEQGFWPSYADMMSALALILFFLMLLSYIQNLITGNDLQNTQELLTDTRAELALTESQVEEAHKELTLLAENLDEAKLTLRYQEEEIESYAREIAGQEKELKEQQELIDWQKDYLAAANTELREMRSQMQTIAVFRLSILEQIRDSIVDVMGDKNSVTIGENGSIILNEGILFDLGSSDIKPASRPMLDQLIQVFTKFLSKADNAQYVDSIVISGHTDSTGTAEENRILSTDRANSVLGYLLKGNNASLDKYAKYFCAAGYGQTRPVQSNATEEGRSANRRIEISIILKDESVLKIVEEYLALELPETGKTQTTSAKPGTTGKK